jgi:hypothetical protein
MKIQASIQVYDEKFPAGVEPAFWVVEGSEAQVYWKMKRQILGLIAAKNVGLEVEAMTIELEKLKVRYNLGEYPKE